MNERVVVRGDELRNKRERQDELVPSGREQLCQVIGGDRLRLVEDVDKIPSVNEYPHACRLYVFQVRPTIVASAAARPRPRCGQSGTPLCLIFLTSLQAA